MKHEYAKDNNGVIHLVSPNQAEFTLCGWAMDAGVDEGGVSWDTCAPQRITCQECLAIIREIKSVPTKYMNPKPPSQTAKE